MHLDADLELNSALKKHNIQLELIVAETAIWVNPKAHERLVQAGNAARYPNSRRARSGKGEKRREIVNGIVFDDNTQANNAIKQAINLPRSQIKGYAVCHVWPETCYDERCHTVLANLVLLPRAIAGLSDHYSPIIAMLQYRSYELYKWLPPNAKMPVRPENYVSCWRPPEPDRIGRKRGRISHSSEKVSKKPVMEARIAKWFSMPDSIVHRLISLAIEHEGMIWRDFLSLLVAQGISKNPSGAVAALKTDAGNAYGPVFEQSHTIIIKPEVKAIMAQIGWA